MQARKPYPSDVTDEQWKIIGALIPKPKGGGAPAKFARREVLNGILYVLRTGCAWRELPHDLPPWDTVYGYFRRWTKEGLWEWIGDRLRDRARPKAAKKAPTAAILDSQSVKTSGQGGPCGYDANKKIKGRKRHLLTDTLGWLLGVEITAANVQDRAGAKPLLRRAKLPFGRLAKIWADSGYSGQFATWVKQLRPHGKLHLEIVRSPKPAKGFAVQPRRWVIERSFAWLTKCRRLVKDYERLTTHSAAFIHLAFTGLMLRSLTH